MYNVYQDEDMTTDHHSRMAVTAHPVAERLDTLMTVLMAYVKDVCHVNGNGTHSKTTGVSFIISMLNIVGNSVKYICQNFTNKFHCRNLIVIIIFASLALFLRLSSCGKNKRTVSRSVECFRQTHPANTCFLSCPVHAVLPL